MTTTSGLPASSISGPDPGAGAGRRRSGRSRSRSRSALRLGVGDRLGDDLQPPDLAAPASPSSGRSCRSRSRGRRRARCRSGRRTRRRPRRGARPSRCWSGRRRRGRSPAAARRAPRAGAPRRARRSARRCRPSRPRSRCGGRPAASGSCAAEVTRRVWIWPVRRPSRTTRLRRTPLARAAVVGGDRLEPGPVADRVAGRVAGLGGEQAVLDADDQVPAAAGVEAEDRLVRRARRRSTRACCGSATARPPARSPPARSRRGRRSGAAPRRPARACGSSWRS